MESTSHPSPSNNILSLEEQWKDFAARVPEWGANPIYKDIFYAGMISMHRQFMDMSEFSMEDANVSLSKLQKEIEAYAVQIVASLSDDEMEDFIKLQKERKNANR